MERDLDVVVYGATGFVGRLTAEHLAAHAPQGVRVGLGGRSRPKLEALRDELGSRAAGWPLLVADSQDRAALDELAARTTVVATTVGPYRRYGLPLAEACAAAGTHYADLTGEVLFLRELIDRCDAPARASGARIVPTCGFDSIPSDLGVWLLHEAAGAPLRTATLVVTGAKGGASGGTIASMKGMVDEARSDGRARKLLLDPYSLSPDRAAEPDLGPQRDGFAPEHDEALGGWVAPFVMGSVNTRVVRRSNALLGHAYGRELRYREVVRTGRGIKGRAAATAMTAGLGAAVAGFAFPVSRFVLDRVLPKPGEGPSEEARRNGFFRIEVHGETEDGRHVQVRVAAQGDPGYAATAVMLGEAALCLALDDGRLPEAAGVLTPATAMGGALVDRLRAAGQTYEVA
jgi:short subunit dehydrogenase-like uncharacterized protein